MLLIYGDFPEEILFFFLLVHRRFQNKQIFRYIYTYNSLIFVETVCNQLANLLQSYLHCISMMRISMVVKFILFIRHQIRIRFYSFRILFKIIFIHQRNNFLTFIFIYVLHFFFFFCWGVACIEPT